MHPALYAALISRVAVRPSMLWMMMMLCAAAQHARPHGHGIMCAGVPWLFEQQVVPRERGCVALDRRQCCNVTRPPVEYELHEAADQQARFACTAAVVCAVWCRGVYCAAGVAFLSRLCCMNLPGAVAVTAQFAQDAFSLHAAALQLRVLGTGPIWHAGGGMHFWLACVGFGLWWWG